MVDLDIVSLTILREGEGVKKFEFNYSREKPIFCDKLIRLKDWVIDARFNEKRIYYTGVAISGTIDGKKLAEYAYELYEKRLIYLTQRKIRNPKQSIEPYFEYIAHRSSNRIERM